MIFVQFKNSKVLFFNFSGFGRNRKVKGFAIKMQEIVDFVRNSEAPTFFSKEVNSISQNYLIKLKDKDGKKNSLVMIHAFLGEFRAFRSSEAEA